MTRQARAHRRTLDQALTEAYRAQADSPLRDELAHDVMREIRRQTNSGGQPSATLWVDDVVWRTATVTVAVVVAMAVCAVGVVRTTGQPAAVMAEGLASVPLLGDE